MITRHNKIILRNRPNCQPPRPRIAFVTPAAQRECLELDRGALARQIDRLCRTIDHNAEELAMVAHEGVFEPELSAQLSQSSRALLALDRTLRALREKIVQAHTPAWRP